MDKRLRQEKSNIDIEVKNDELEYKIPKNEITNTNKFKEALIFNLT